MALWAICWAGSKPLASLVDGGLASIVPHLWIAAAALALPAVLLAVAEISLPKKAKGWIKDQAVRVSITPSAAATLREKVRSWASLTSTQLSAWLRRGLALAGNGDAAERVVGELAEFLRGQHVAPVAAGLIGFVARVTGDPARYGDEFRSELWELADGGKGRWGQLAYALRQLVAAGALRIEANSPRGRETSP
jgi:hypothetical protein